MQTRSIAIALAVVVVVAVLAEIFVFRFHTAFQRNEVQEALPSVSSALAPLTVVQGAFVAVDGAHRGSGTARIISADGKRYLRLENFEVSNGPDLYVYLSESKTPANTLQSLGKYVSLGELKGNAGNQTYDIPDSIRGYDTALIWCQRFGVLFTYAVMR
jgi:hypothetical protein